MIRELKKYGVAVFVGISAILLLASQASAWTATVGTTFTEDCFYAGDTVQMSVHFENTDETEVKVTNVSVRFDWMPGGKYNSSAAVPATVGPGGTYVFYFTVTIPSDVPVGNHDYQVVVEASDAKEPSGWDVPYLMTYDFVLHIEDEAQADEDLSCSCSTAEAVMLMALAPMAVFAWTRRR